VGTAPETGAVGVIRFSVLSGAVAAGSAANQVGSWSRPLEREKHLGSTVAAPAVVYSKQEQATQD
jgi:hypothetical protein